jgi:N-hydroxyarylamine O-acetyltransferase
MNSSSSPASTVSTTTPSSAATTTTTTIEDEILFNYLKRIQYPNKYVDTTIETLCLLHRCHIFNVQFENLSLHMNQNISIRSDDVYDKIVTRKRGGYCLETNRLFVDMIRRIGFTVKQLGARVIWGTNRCAILPMTHQLALVTVDSEEYICDVGFGGFAPLLEPMPLRIDCVTQILTSKFRLIQDDECGYVMQWKCAVSEPLSEWRDMYCFRTIQELFSVDYEMMNYYVSTNPRSLFVNNLFVSLPTSEGMIVLFNSTLKIRKNGQVTTYPIEDMNHCRALLGQYFDLDILPDVVFDKVQFGSRGLTQSPSDHFSLQVI